MQKLQGNGEVDFLYCSSFDLDTSMAARTCAYGMRHSARWSVGTNFRMIMHSFLV